MTFNPPSIRFRGKPAQENLYNLSANLSKNIFGDAKVLQFAQFAQRQWPKHSSRATHCTAENRAGAADPCGSAAPARSVARHHLPRPIVRLPVAPRYSRNGLAAW